MKRSFSTGKNVLVTGGSGFVGSNLVKELVRQDWRVTCLVRGTSRTAALEASGCRLVTGDLDDQAALRRAVKNQDLVFHLAAKTCATSAGELMRVNVAGTRHLLTACRSQCSPPAVLLTSSLAAAGPSPDGAPLAESATCQPVSQYGISKLESEAVARQFSDEVPVSIVRPPIVLGPGDRQGLALFKSIASLGIHVVAGTSDHDFSVIHADDLARAMIRIATSGQRLSTADPEQGLYFASSRERPTYRQLGEWIGAAVGRSRVHSLYVPGFAIRSLASANSLIGRVTGKPLYLNRDKAREALAGSWACSAEKIRNELGFLPACGLQERLNQTAAWYRDAGWLKGNRGQFADTAMG